MDHVPWSEYGSTVARPILAGFGQDTAYIEQLCARIPDALRTLRNSLTARHSD